MLLRFLMKQPYFYSYLNKTSNSHSNIYRKNWYLLKKICLWIYQTFFYSKGRNTFEGQTDRLDHLMTSENIRQKRGCLSTFIFIAWNCRLRKVQYYVLEINLWYWNWQIRHLIFASSYKRVTNIIVEENPWQTKE